MAADRVYGVLVEDIKVLNTRQGHEWWLLWRARMQQAGRVQVLPGSSTPAGDHVWIRCDDPLGETTNTRATAEELLAMLASRGLPSGAIRVVRRPAFLEATDAR